VNRSLRFRLTLLYSCFFAVLFVLASAFLYSALSHSLNARLDETLASEADTALGLFADEFEELGRKADPAAREVVNDMKLRGDFVAVTEGPRVLAAKPSLPLQEVSGERWRLAERRVTLGGIEYRVVVAATLDPIHAALAALRRDLAVGLPVALLLAGIGAWLVATRVLRPLESVAAQAQRITEHSLNTRIEAEGAAAELEVVIASFNDLLGRLDRSFEAMRRFVADASHELRTPVSVIRGEADVSLSRERTAEEYRESLEVVLDEARRLSVLVEDLLNLARADSGRVRLEIHEFYLNELLAECCRKVRAAGLTIECVPGSDVQFRGDEVLLRRLMMNLLDNAVRYTPQGGRVTVSLEAADDWVCIRVADTGIGMAPGEERRVFERFYRTDEARARAAGGFGLGLSIVRWIAEAHRGSAECTSELGRGSVFAVKLPRHVENGARGPGAVAALSASSPEEPSRLS
jgi:heavy metal sensor kinase